MLRFYDIFNDPSIIYALIPSSLVEYGRMENPIPMHQADYITIPHDCYISLDDNKHRTSTSYFQSKSSCQSSAVIMSTISFTVPPLDNTLGAVFLGGAIAAMYVLPVRFHR